jgi:hypothetical protein
MDTMEAGYHTMPPLLAISLVEGPLGKELVEPVNR